jgi:predicted N-acyltransferase
MQFHWHNRREPPYRDFEDYLGAFKSRHRKQVRHERAVAAGHGLRFETRTGTEMSDVDWRASRAFYEANATKHGGMEYLTPAFFEIVRATYAHRVVATLAYRGDTPVAGTFNFEKGRHVYGRYWGSQAEYSMLHFELCYHRLIERAIARQATRFEAGAQGEHKLKRGLVPSYTHSAHWIGHPGLASAVTDFIAAEADAVRDQVAALSAESPFHAPAAGAAPPPDDEPPPAG